jgi:hypothetical protein
MGRIAESVDSEGGKGDQPEVYTFTNYNFFIVSDCPCRSAETWKNFSLRFTMSRIDGPEYIYIHQSLFTDRQEEQCKLVSSSILGAEVRASTIFCKCCLDGLKCKVNRSNLRG